MITTIILLTTVDVFLTLCMWHLYRQYDKLVIELGRLYCEMMRHHGGDCNDC